MLWGKHRALVLTAAVGSIALAGLVSAPRPASAQADAWPAIANTSHYDWREIYGGVDAARDQRLLYSGMTIAPPARGIYGDGWRLRFGGGYGRYGYDAVGPHTNCGVAWQNNICTDAGRERRHYEVAHSYAEALLGYYLQLGRLTAKAFAGAAMSSEQPIKATDPSQRGYGTEFGIKGALELWLTLGETGWTSLDVSYASARNETASRWRTGWRLAPKLSLGPELRYDKNVETGDGAWNGRTGLFARYEWTGGEVSLAGGAAWWVKEWSSKDPSAYGTFNVLFQY